MQHIDILLTSRPEGGAADYLLGGLGMTFHVVDPTTSFSFPEGIKVAFVDCVLPRLSALEFCRRLRCDPGTAQAFVIVVLGGYDDEARRQFLRVGVNDYMIGPVRRTDIIERVTTTLGLNLNNQPNTNLVIGDLSVSTESPVAWWGGKILNLSSNDLRLLRFFCDNPNRVFTRQQLINALGKDDEKIDERTVDVWIGRLRRNLGKAGVTHELRTVRNLGYVFDFS